MSILPPSDLQQQADECRQRIVKMAYAGRAGHPAESLAVIDFLATLYLGGALRFDPKNPSSSHRDFFILSESRFMTAAYAILTQVSLLDEQEWFTYGQPGSRLQAYGSPSIPGLEFTGGEPGQGFAFAQGMAMAAQMDHQKKRIFVLLSQKECQSPLFHKATLTSRIYSLPHLIPLIDCSNPVRSQTSDSPLLEASLKTLGWDTFTIDGHDFSAIASALDQATLSSQKPRALLFNTIQGKGISFMEKSDWIDHPLEDEEFEQAIAELGAGTRTVTL